MFYWTNLLPGTPAKRESDIKIPFKNACSSLGSHVRGLNINAAAVAANRRCRQLAFPESIREE